MLMYTQHYDYLLRRISNYLLEIGEALGMNKEDGDESEEEEEEDLGMDVDDIHK